MKINSSRLRQFILMLIVLTPLMSLKNNSPQKYKPEIKLNEWMFSSQRISIDEANLLISTYLASNNVLTSTHDNSNTPALRYFSFKAIDMEAILSRLDAGDGTADKVVFKLGISASHRWQLVAYSMQDGKLIESQDPSTGRYSIFYNSENPSTGSNPNEAGRARSTYAGKHPLRRSDAEGVLEGFSFNADHIEEILNNNASGKTPNRLIIGIGLENPGDNPRWHVIAFGARGKQALDFGDDQSGSRLNIKLISYKTTKAASVFDKADPCPPCN